VPGTVDNELVRVSWEDPPALREPEEKAALIPLGSPLTVKATG
jgi:hypothetical protein